MQIDLAEDSIAYWSHLQGCNGTITGLATYEDKEIPHNWNVRIDGNEKECVPCFAEKELILLPPAGSINKSNLYNNI